MKIDIPSSKEKYFRQILEILSSLPPFNTMSAREKDVLSQLLFYNWRGIEFSKDERDAFVFSKASKEKMRHAINISKPSFDNQMAALRRKGFITYSSIVPKFEIKKIDEELTFIFDV